MTSAFEISLLLLMLTSCTSRCVLRLRRLWWHALMVYLLLSAYSPDLSCIEYAFSKFKSVLRSLRPHSDAQRRAAIHEGLAAIAPADARSYYEHVGYTSRGGTGLLAGILAGEEAPVTAVYGLDFAPAAEATHTAMAAVGTDESTECGAQSNVELSE